jgi:O-antigen ligase
MSPFFFQSAAAAPARDMAVAEQPARWSYWLLLAFMSLLYANTPFVLPAVEVLRPAAVVGGCALLALLGETIFGSHKFEFAWPEGAWLLAFVGGAALSCLTALWPGHAAHDVADLAKMALVFFFLVNCVASESRLRGVMWVMVVCGLLPALGTLRNYRAGNLVEGRAAWVGIFANPNEVAYALVVLLPLALYLASSSGWLQRLALLAISITYLPAIYVTFSRGGLIGLAAVAAIYAWRKRSIWMQAVIVAAAIGGAVFLQQHWSRGQDFSQLDNDVSFQQRIATSQAGLVMFLDHPWLGVGFGCSVIAWPLYAPQGLYTRGALVTHNTVVQVLGETGLVGAAPFLIFIGMGLYYSRRLALRSNTRNLGIAVEVSLWGLAVCGMSGGYVLTWFPYILMGLAAAARRIAGPGAAEDQR